MIEYESLGGVNEPYFQEYETFFASFIRKGWYILGDEVKNFEEEFTGYCGAKHCVGVANGLDALTISLKSLDLPEGSEVIVPSNTYIATVLSVLQAGLKPVLVEPRLDNYNLDPSLIKAAVTSKTKVILVVHLYGKMTDMEEVMRIAEEHGLFVIEDCAQSHGAMLNGKKAGTFGHLSAFSFYPTKTLGALGDAGAIVTNDSELTGKIKALRNYGSEKKYYNKYIGYNSRLDELQAGLLRIKLKHLDAFNGYKNKLATIYFENICSPLITLPVKEPGKYDVFHIFNIRCKKRDSLKQYLQENGIKTEIHYPVPPHQQEGYRHIFAGNYPVSEEIHNTTLSLPISVIHTEADIISVCKTINNFS